MTDGQYLSSQCLPRMLDYSSELVDGEVNFHAPVAFLHSVATVSANQPPDVFSGTVASVGVLGFYFSKNPSSEHHERD